MPEQSDLYAQYVKGFEAGCDACIDRIKDPCPDLDLEDGMVEDLEGMRDRMLMVLAEWPQMQAARAIAATRRRSALIRPMRLWCPVQTWKKP